MSAKKEPPQVDADQETPQDPSASSDGGVKRSKSEIEAAGHEVEHALARSATMRSQVEDSEGDGSRKKKKKSGTATDDPVESEAKKKAQPKKKEAKQNEELKDITGASEDKEKGAKTEESGVSKPEDAMLVDQKDNKEDEKPKKKKDLTPEQKAAHARYMRFSRSFDSHVLRTLIVYSWFANVIKCS